MRSSPPTLVFLSSSLPFFPIGLRQGGYVIGEDGPLIVQFAASSGPDLAKAAEFILPYSDGLDLNCGCPQRWAMQEGYGSKLIYQAEKVADMVAAVRRLPAPSHPFTVSVKIRLHPELEKTLELCRQAEAAGVCFISVHARTPQMRHDPILEDALKLVKDSCGVPVIANGDIFSLQQGLELAERTGVDGLMSARGILHNPALFAGEKVTPLSAVSDWVDLALGSGLAFTLFHHHAMFMLSSHLTKAEKRTFHRLQSVPAVLDYLESHFGI